MKQRDLIKKLKDAGFHLKGMEEIMIYTEEAVI